MKPKFRTKRDGGAISDRIERCRCRLEPSPPVSPTAVPPVHIAYAMDPGTSDGARSTVDAVFVRDSGAASIRDGSPNPALDRPAEYATDPSRPLNVPALIDSAVRIDDGTDRTRHPIGERTATSGSERSYSGSAPTVG